MHYFFPEYSPLKEAPKLSVANENMNNNYQTVNKVVDLPNASGDTMDWKKKFEMKSAQFDEVSHVNWYLMTTLNKMEMEMQGHVSVIQELKSSIKVRSLIQFFFVFVTGKWNLALVSQRLILCVSQKILIKGHHKKYLKLG